MPEILTYNTPGKTSEKKVKQGNPWFVSKSVYSWFRVQDKFTKTYVVAFLMIAVATPFIVGQYLNYSQKASAPSVENSNELRVGIVSPSDGETVVSSSTTAIAVNIPTNAEISSITFLVNGVEKCNLSKEPFICNWKVPEGAGITYSISVAATDKIGKTAIDMTTVTSR